jgi:HD-GYP domain-containing protein (c-di-GMP phosphodiesterase class II)
MNPVEWLSVSISQLQTGLPLRYDIYSKQGELLAKSGDEFTEITRASWAELGVDTVYAKKYLEVKEAAALAPYNQLVIQSLTDCITATVSLLTETINQLGSSNSVLGSQYEGLTENILQNITNDSAAAMQVVCQSILQSHSDQVTSLASRCSQLSVLSMAIACEMGLVPTEIETVGLAAMLHDISLISENLDRYPLTKAYRIHPVVSAEIVEATLGMASRIGIPVAQVHEMPAGDGFPQGLSGEAISPYARIINLADAYLTLTLDKQHAMMPRACHFHPADAIGYLMFHATQGRFEMNAVRALIRTSSLYPIGSHVILSDNSSAVVYRSTRIAPSKPVIKLDSTHALVDLRHSSLSVRGPNRQLQGYQPLVQSKLPGVLWL